MEGTSRTFANNLGSARKDWQYSGQIGSVDMGLKGLDLGSIVLESIGEKEWYKTPTNV